MLSPENNDGAAIPDPAPDNGIGPHAGVVPPARVPETMVLPAGPFKIIVGDRNSREIQPLPGEEPNPYAVDAVNIGFVVKSNPVLTAQQVELQANIEKIVRTCNRLFLGDGIKRPDSFRTYFVRLFYLAQMGLENNVPAELFNSVLATITADLIEDEAAAMKNGHLLKLGRYAAYYSLPALLVYLTAKLATSDAATAMFFKLKIDPDWLAGFALLWAGCFTGVWLSYGIRKTRISLTDLILSDADYLAPHIRLVFAGMLTMILGILFAMKLIDVRIGNVSLTDFASYPLMAYLVGLFCGISEAALPASIGSRAATFIQSVR